MEEIDIIELLKRVKEGKAPKRIEIKGRKFSYDENTDIIQYLYENLSEHLFNVLIDFDTKIKILDKPIIEELEEIEFKSCNDMSYLKILIRSNRDKINEIIRRLKEGGK